MRQVGALAYVQVAVLAHQRAPVRFPLVLEQVPVGAAHFLAVRAFEFELDDRFAVLGPGLLALQTDAQHSTDQFLVGLLALEQFVVAVEEHKRGTVGGGNEEFG